MGHLPRSFDRLRLRAAGCAVRWHEIDPQLLVEDLDGFNLVGYRNRVIAIPQADGAFDQQRVDRCGYSAAYIGKSVPEVIQAVKTARH